MLTTRRAFLQKAALMTAAVALTETPGWGQTPRVRHSVATPEGRGMLEKYARAVRLMQSPNRADRDPMSWTFQWYTHAVPGDKAAALRRVFGDGTSPARTLAADVWSTCQPHFSGMDIHMFLPWHRIARHWKPELLADFEDALARTDIGNDQLRKTLAEIASNVDAAGVDILDRIVPRLTPTRSLEFVLDLERARAGELAQQLIERLPSVDSEIAQMLLDLRETRELHAFMAPRSADVRARIAALCPQSPDSVVRILICLAALCEGSILATAERLLATGDVDEGSPALFALTIRDDPEERALIRQALTHDRYPVRRMAMQHLVPIATDDDRAALLAMASDRSADIRLAWAELMRVHRWLEAEPLLAQLVLDGRDFSLDRHHGIGQSWPRYAVARSAARALDAYDTLADQSIDALLEACKSDDPFVHCAALKALSSRSDDRIPVALRAAFAVPGLNDDPDYRVVSQAATWAYFDRALDGLPLDAEDIAALENVGETGPPLARWNGPSGTWRRPGRCFERLPFAARSQGAGGARRLAPSRLSFRRAPHWRLPADRSYHRPA